MREKHNFSHLSQVVSVACHIPHQQLQQQTSHKPNEVKRLKRNMPPFSRAKHTHTHTPTPTSTFTLIHKQNAFQSRKKKAKKKQKKNQSVGMH